jgi:hypothetical protein
MKTIRTLFQRLFAIAALVAALCVGFNPMHALAASSAANSKTHSVILAVAKKATAKKTTKTSKKPKITKTTKTSAAKTATVKTAKKSTSTAKTTVKKTASVAKNTTAKTTVKPAKAVSKTTNKSAVKPVVKSSSKRVLPKTSVVTAAKKTTTKKTTAKKSTVTTAKPKASAKKTSSTAKKSSQPELSVSANTNGGSADVENIVQPAAPADVYQDGKAEIVSDPENNSDNSFITKLISEDNPGSLSGQDKISAAVKTFISSIESAIKQLF